jgi:hypothetical protein
VDRRVYDGHVNKSRKSLRFPAQTDLATQVLELERRLCRNLVIDAILSRADLLGLPNWYLGAGCIAQTIWNLGHGFDPGAYIKDYDLVYFDDSDLSYEAEDGVIQRAKELFVDIEADIEVRNQARVHLWFERKFGRPLAAYASVEDAMDTWPLSVGVCRRNGRFQVYAPYGLSDVFGLVVRPNKTEITREVYEGKIARWKAVWPKLQVIDWDTGKLREG